MKLAIILGSARAGRLGERVAHWVVATAKEQASIDATLLDLHDFNLPFMREAHSPRYNSDRRPVGDVKRWLDTIAAADAYVFITPEYNRGYPGELKNALDTIGHEADKKPAAIISYSSGPTGGLAAQQALRPVVNALDMSPIPAI